MPWPRITRRFISGEYPLAREHRIAERGEIALGVALAHEHREIRGVACEPRVEAERRRAERAPGMSQDGGGGRLYAGAHRERERTRIRRGVAVDVVRGIPQHRGGGMQRNGNRSEMRTRMGIGVVVESFPHRLSERLGRAEPARRDARPAMPEARPPDVLPLPR